MSGLQRGQLPGMGTCRAKGAGPPQVATFEFGRTKSAIKRGLLSLFSPLSSSSFFPLFSPSDADQLIKKEKKQKNNKER